MYGCAGMTGKEAYMKKTVDILGTTMTYVEAGRGTPVVYVHGNTGSSRWFSLVMDIPGVRTVAVDMPNFGDSGSLAIADIDAYADHVATFIRTLGLEKPVLVGHSLGGAVIMALAARNPALPRALVLVDSAAPTGLKTPEAHYPYIEMFRTNRDMMKQALAAVTPALRDAALLDALTDDAMRMAGHAFAGNARALERFDYTGRAGAFSGPVLVIWGRKDTIITEEMVRATAAAYGDARLEIVDAVGHSLPVEDPALFKKLVGEFMSSLK